MLRFISERRAWALVTAFVLLLVLGLGVWGALRATARASSLIGDRLGMDARIEEADLSLSGVELRGLEMRGRHGGISVHIDRLDARMNVLAALFTGARSVRAVSARGVRVMLDLSEDGLGVSLSEMKTAMRGARLAPSSPGAKARGRTYSVEGMSIRVVDSRGQLAVIRDAKIHKDGDELRSSVGRTWLGDPGADHARIGPTKVVLRRTDRIWRLQELDIEEAHLRSFRDGEDASDSLTLRARGAWAFLRDTGKGTVLKRAGDEDPGAPEPHDPQRLFDRLTPNASVSVSGARIESRTTGGHVERVQNLELALRGTGDGWFRITMSGQTSNGGTLNVDLGMMPGEARAEGNFHLRRISLALIAPFVPELPLYDTDAGTLGAELDLVASSPEQVRIGGSLRLRDLAVSSERIAPVPVEHIRLDLGGKGVWHPGERRLEIERGQIRIGKARVLIDGELERTSEHYRIDLTAKLPPTRCNDVVAAIPRDILGELTKFEWSGNWSAVGHISLDSRELEETELSMRVRNLCEFERIPAWASVERFQKPFRHRVLESDETVFEMLTGPGTDAWVSYAEISPFVPAAVISHEDGAFYEHAGFAPWAIRDALVRNLQEGRYVVGASTISMQLAKNLYLHREKTIARKVQEVILTWWLENSLDKDQILELYLNVIEYGPSVYGLRHAAVYYFGRDPIDLSPAESAFLACVLPAPKRYQASYERGELTRSMRNRVRRLLEHMAKRERIGPEALAYGLAELEELDFRRPGDPMAQPRVLPPLGAPEVPDAEGLDPFESLFIQP